MNLPARYTWYTSRRRRKFILPNK